MSTVAKQWLDNTRAVMDRIEQTQIPSIRKAAEAMADTIQAERWVHTFGCGHATIPIEDMYPRIGGFVGFHPMCELPLTFFTRIVGEGGVHQFVFLERVEGYGIQIMKGAGEKAAGHGGEQREQQGALIHLDVVPAGDVPRDVGRHSGEDGLDVDRKS